MKKLLVTMGGVQSIRVIPDGSSIRVDGSGSRIIFNKRGANTFLVVSDTISSLFSQLTDSIKFTSEGETIVLMLTPFSKIVAYGSGSKITHRLSTKTRTYTATETVAVLNAQLSVGIGGVVADGQFTKITDTSIYTVTHNKNNSKLSGIGIFDSSGNKHEFTVKRIDENAIRISDVTNFVSNGTYDVYLTFA